MMEVQPLQGFSIRTRSWPRSLERFSTTVTISPGVSAPVLGELSGKSARTSQDLRTLYTTPLVPLRLVLLPVYVPSGARSWLPL